MKRRIPESTLQKIQYVSWEGDLSEHFTFRYWREKWDQVLNGLDSNEGVSDIEFLQQDKVTTLMYDDQIVGMHLIKQYDANNLLQYPYFRQQGEGFIFAIKQRNIRRLQALQYFIVSEDWSVSNTLVNFGAIIACLSLRHQIADSLDATITIARTDIPVTSLGKKIGFEEISSAQMHNVPVAYLMCLEATPHPKADVNKWVDYYWDNRQTHVINDQTKKVG